MFISSPRTIPNFTLVILRFGSFDLSFTNSALIIVACTLFVLLLQMLMQTEIELCCS